MDDRDDGASLQSGMRRNALRAFAALSAHRAQAEVAPLLGVAVAPARAANDWPSRPIRLVVINRAFTTDKLKARLATEGAEAALEAPAAFGALIESEIARWKPAVERANMRPQ
jgi:tripartite-type tricarboxylate transporter receptor subunit TctC